MNTCGIDPAHLRNSAAEMKRWVMNNILVSMGVVSMGVGYSDFSIMTQWVRVYRVASLF